MNESVVLPRDSNQALGIGRFCVNFLAGALGPGPSEAVLARTKLFHIDALLCGVSALALRTNAPRILREEALTYGDLTGATVIGSDVRVKPEKAVVANSAAMREWDANGTNFGYNPALGHMAGEFGHNDYYPAVIAACQKASLDGATALRAMVLIDEIRGRLAEVFSLKTYKIDHVVHGAIASAAVYAALLGGIPEQIESAIGMFVAHYIPWRAIRAGKQLSDSKGASAAISSEAAVLCAERALAGFVGPGDIFRNPEALFRQFEPTNGDSPFNLVLSHTGDDFAVMGMHFKLGLYEHQAAGALQGVINLLAAHPELRELGGIAHVLIRTYEPAFGIIGDPAKRDPKTRQSADHSMVYIIATLLGKAVETGITADSTDEMWKELMLGPSDYDEESLVSPATRQIMSAISFEHGGPEYDARYPDGIPTSVEITTSTGERYDSGLVMYPAGHARNHDADLRGILAHKFEMHGRLGLPDAQAVVALMDRLDHLEEMSSTDVAEIYTFEIK